MNYLNYMYQFKLIAWQGLWTINDTDRLHHQYRGKILDTSYFFQKYDPLQITRIFKQALVVAAQWKPNFA